MVIQYNTMAASASAGLTQRGEGWTNLPARRQEEVTAVRSEREEKGGHNVPPPTPTQRD